ncbi:type I-F CRISPR-associated protein Csy2 [Modicisalibacter tunisiensis]|uniref:type I-F CRISPR-associated protein Csy2 n=1 Tax=Modicisalibacter tunisiensis TaxID=390637 RepID=UPI001CCAA97E|nr:type I-F CRISPR-associated protein Csy2 [Modicisalibacter tunisiensis]MBZ9539517.1 type I-F CRISPR-associated protein Csy2 [Modicisalibacter tunisiensis]
MNDRLDHILVLPRLRIQNANAISSPMTWGFPAMSAFMGAIQALERKLPDEIKLIFEGVGVVCHRIEPQVTDGGFIKAFHLTRNPVDKSGNTAAIVEEGRAHLEITLLIGVGSEEEDLNSFERRQALARQIFDQIQGMRIAGGSVMPSMGQTRYRPELVSFDADEDERKKQWSRLRRRLLPGFALVLRDDRLQAHTETLQAQDASATALDAWLDLSRLNHECHVTVDENDKETVEWRVRRPFPGWLVPVPVGYGAISELYPPGEVANARDPSVPFQFVESLYSVGEWVSPHRIKTPDDLMWIVENDLDRGIYRLVNDYAQTQFDEQ